MINFLFYQNRTRFLRERIVSPSITIWSLATIQTAAMYISFFHFEVQVASRDCRNVIFARIRIRIDNFWSGDGWAWARKMADVCSEARVLAKNQDDYGRR